MNQQRTGAPPTGRTRVSDAVLETITMIAAREVGGVADIAEVAGGAVVGGVVGGTLGFAGGGAAGAAVGVPVGSAVGAAAAHLARRRRPRYHAIGDRPSVQVHLSARYGTDLVQTARDVRTRIREHARQILGMELEDVRVIFTRIVAPQSSTPQRRLKTSP